MKILIVASPWIGGSGTLGYELAEHLSHKHKSYFVSFDFPYRQSGKSNLLLINTVPATYSLFSYPLYQTSLTERIVEIVNRYKIDLIHAHYSIVFGESAIIAKRILSHQRKKIKVVLTFHGSDAVGFSPENPGKEIFEETNKWLISEADAVTTPSNWMANFIKKTYKVKNPLLKVSNFYDNKTFTKTGGFADRKYFIHVSNFRAVKRPLEAVKAFDLIADRLDNIQLVMIGKGPEKETVRDYLKRMPVKNVILKGIINKEELKRFYNQSLALILPSTFENFPLTILEAAACGTPAIVTNVGGLSEAVIDQKTGFLIKNTKDPIREIAQRMLEVRKPRLWHSLSDKAVRHVKRFTKEMVVPQFEKIYQQII